jgi:hypothetical protein
MTAADHRDVQLGQNFRVAPYIEDKRRVIDLFQPLRVGRIVQKDERRARSNSACPLLPRQFCRLSLASGCTETASRPAPNAASGLAKRSTRFLDLVGARPGVSERAKRSRR